jgi:ElaA protein
LFAELTLEELYAFLRLRTDVFVVEQACPYPELDGLDALPTTRHFWIEDLAKGRSGPLAYLRLLDEGEGVFRIGRVCTARGARSHGFSRELMAAALVEVGDAECVLHAQSYVTDFYASFGFQVEGAEFMEDGIPHVIMRRPRA